MQSNLIIDQATNLSWLGKLIRLAITLCFWLVMLYLWQPLISMVAWSFKIKLFYEHMIILGGYQSFLSTIYLYMMVVGTFCGGLILWANINQWRSRGKERRQPLAKVSPEQIADFYGVPKDQIAGWQHFKNCTVYFDQDNQIQGVETKGVSLNSQTQVL